MVWLVGPAFDVNKALPSVNLSPLHYAVKSSSVEVVKVLLKHPGIHLNDRDSRGNTVFQSATGNSAVVNWICKEKIMAVGGYSTQTCQEVLAPPPKSSVGFDPVVTFLVSAGLLCGAIMCCIWLAQIISASPAAPRSETRAQNPQPVPPPFRQNPQPLPTTLRQNAQPLPPTLGQNTPLLTTTLGRCIICDENNVELMEVNATCRHRFCLGCIQQQISTTLKARNTQVKCLECGQFASPQVINVAASHQDILLLDQIVRSRSPNFRHCLGPKCGHGQVGYFVVFSFSGVCILPSPSPHPLQIHNPAGPTVACEECEFSMCFLHQVPANGHDCVQFEIQQVPVATMKLIESTSKKCPKCHHWIEKNDGCDHMTCRCSHQFCWVCSADYDPIRKHGNSRHQVSCKHYA